MAKALRALEARVDALEQKFAQFGHLLGLIEPDDVALLGAAADMQLRAAPPVEPKPWVDDAQTMMTELSARERRAAMEAHLELEAGKLRVPDALVEEAERVIAAAQENMRKVDEMFKAGRIGDSPDVDWLTDVGALPPGATSTQESVTHRPEVFGVTPTDHQHIGPSLSEQYLQDRVGTSPALFSTPPNDPLAGWSPAPLLKDGDVIVAPDGSEMTLRVDEKTTKPARRTRAKA